MGADPQLQLVPATPELLDAAVDGDEALATELGHPVAPGWVSFRQALERTRANLQDARWGTRLFVAGDPPELVGWGGFKGPPCGGTVELGYEIAECRQNRGHATAATKAMLAEAFADRAVTRVIAHTEPEPNASSRVLEKAGFEFAGATEEDGQVVWRWVIARDLP